MVFTQLQAFLDSTIAGNTGLSYMQALISFLVLFGVFILIRTYVLFTLRRLAKQTRMKYDDMIVEALWRLKWPFYAVVSLYIATRPLVLSGAVDRVLYLLLFATILYYAVHQAGIAVHWMIRKWAGEQEDPAFLAVLSNVIKAALWVLAGLLLLQNLGIQITPLIAALGVGGIAIAFALQNILEDLFSSFSIYFDKPFKEGDFIIIGNDMGTVKSIGLKTTRLQTLQGQELIISNRELTSARVNNYKRMNERRIQFQFGIEYSTPTAKVKNANEIVRDVIKKAKHARLDRTHFKQFGDFALLFEIVYYVDSADYNTYMDVQQEINLQIKERFERAHIKMAFPTQVIHLQK